MTENNSTNSNLLDKDKVSDLSENFSIAVRYVNEDLEKARATISGSYKCVFVVKLSFFSQKNRFDKPVYGFLLLSFLIDWKKLISTDVVLLFNGSYTNYLSKIFEGWVIFQESLKKFADLDSRVESFALADYLHKELANDSILKIIVDKEPDIMLVQKFMERPLKEYFSDQQMEVRMDTEFVNAIIFHANQKLSIVYDIFDSSDRREADKDMNRTSTGKVVIHSLPIIMGTAKYASELRVGEDVRVLFSEINETNNLIAKSLGILREREGGYSSVVAKVQKILKTKNHYEIFATVMPRVIAKVVLGTHEQISVVHQVAQKKARSVRLVMIGVFVFLYILFLLLLILY